MRIFAQVAAFLSARIAGEVIVKDIIAGALKLSCKNGLSGIGYPGYAKMLNKMSFSRSRIKTLILGFLEYYLFLRFSRNFINFYFSFQFSSNFFFQFSKVRLNGQKMFLSKVCQKILRFSFFSKF